MLFSSKALNAANLELQTYEKNQLNFLWNRTGVDFGFHNNFAKLGSFASFRSCRL